MKQIYTSSTHSNSFVYFKKFLFLSFFLFLNIQVISAQCGNNDCDGDGIENFADLDDDNDGILDTDEGYVASQEIPNFNSVIYPSELRNNGTSGVASGRLAEIVSCDTIFKADFDFVSTGGDIPILDFARRNSTLNNELVIRYRSRDGSVSLSGTSQVTYTFSETVNVRLALFSNNNNEAVTFITPFDRIIPGTNSTIVPNTNPVVWHNQNSNDITIFEFDNVSSITLGLSGTNLVLSGNLTVNGTTTSVQTTNSEIKDSILLINDGAAGSTNNSNDAGLIIERGTGDGGNIAAVYDEGIDKFAFYKTSATSASTDISGDDGSATLIDVKANDVVLGDGNNLGSLADFTAAMA